MSIHVNASTNRRIKGFETFLHSWDKTGTAIDVAARENAVIKFEEKKINYEKLSMERKITATMASSMFLKESEGLAAMIQDELGKILTVPNRGLNKQGFMCYLVLVCLVFCLKVDSFQTLLKKKI